MPSTVGRCVVTLFAFSLSAAGCSRHAGDADGRPAARYDPATGRLQQLRFDSTGDGRHDAVGIMDGVRVQRIELDEDQDGHTDRWEFYDEHRRLERVGFSRLGNGVMDAVAYYGDDATLARVEISGDRGQVGRIEYYEGGVLARVEEDTNGDDRIDKWETYLPGHERLPGEPASLVTVAFDDAFRGTPNRRLHYDRAGTVVRVEVDREGDGQFTEWKEGRQ